MKFRKTAYLEQIVEAEWNRIIAGIPRENLEAAIYDFSFSSGVASGLEVVQTTVPNLTVTVKRGRAVLKDDTTRRGRVLEAHSDITFNLSSFLPSGSPSTVLLVAEPLLNEDVEAPITPPNAPPGTDSYDPAYFPVPFKPLERDDLQLSVVGSATPSQVVLAAITLSSGMTAILNSHIKAQTDPQSPRQIAAPNPEIVKLKLELENLKPKISPVGSVISWAGPINRIPNGFVLCDGRELSRVDYPELFSLLAITFGSGDGVNTFQIPDLRDRFVVGSGNAYSLNAQGGANEVALSVNQLPSHDHAVTINGVNDHDHAVTVSDSGNHRHNFRGSYLGNSGDTGPLANEIQGNTVETGETNWDDSFGVLEGGNHTHSVDVLPSGGHSHGAAIGNTGNNQAHENRPPYVGLFQIIRVQ